MPNLLCHLPALGCLVLALPAIALDCPDPPVQTKKDWDATVRSEVAKIGTVKGADLGFRVRSTTQDLLGRLPGADRLYLEQMMFAAYCSALRGDREMTEGAKAKQIMDYRRELQSSLKR
jgi:hypothetical protein